MRYNIDIRVVVSLVVLFELKLVCLANVGPPRMSACASNRISQYGVGSV
jgi:hypothetical protein